MSTLLKRRAAKIIKAPAVLRGLWEDDVSRLPPDLRAILPGLVCPKVGSSRINSTAGSQNFTTIGSNTFTVPIYTTLAVTVTGGGGSGGQCSPSGYSGNVGNNSTFNDLVANGGGAGGNGYSVDGSGGAGGSGSAPGGTLYNGYTGGAAASYNGGFGYSAPGWDSGSFAGGSYNYGNGNSATNYGGSGGGVGGFFGAQGGGGGGGTGALVTRNYTPGQLTPGASISVFIGFGGAAGASELGGFFGAGYQGIVTTSWT